MYNDVFMNEKKVIQERQKKKGIKLETTGAALIILGGLEILFTSVTPILGIAAILLGGRNFYEGWKLIHNHH